MPDHREALVRAAEYELRALRHLPITNQANAVVTAIHAQAEAAVLERVRSAIEAIPEDSADAWSDVEEFRARALAVLDVGREVSRGVEGDPED